MQTMQHEIGDAIFSGEHPFPQRTDDQRGQDPGREQQPAHEVRAGKALREEQRHRQADADLGDHVDGDEDRRIDQDLLGTTGSANASR